MYSLEGRNSNSRIATGSCFCCDVCFRVCLWWWQHYGTGRYFRNKHRNEEDLVVSTTTTGRTSLSMLRVSLFLWIAASWMANVSSSSQNISTCDSVMTCHEGASCIRGDADYSWQPKDINGVPFSFLQITNRDGYYCDCPDGWTGLRCNHPYVICQRSNHICYNGGKCIDGIDLKVAPNQLFCDCTNAQHKGVPYVGKYCETEGAVQCGNTEIFCANGGSCADGFENLTYPCNCRQGYRGPHCEFDNGYVPNCTLQCQNGGSCMLGIKNYDTALLSEFWARHDGNFTYCECPQGWYGPKCEIQGLKCGNMTCFNGAKCLETEHSNGQVEYTCDCSTANNGVTSFAGDYCENEASTFCPNSPSNPNGNLFCVNGGTCNKNPQDGCNCPTGYHGPICEFRDSQIVDECRLQCQNGGRCRSGKKDNKLFEQFGNELLLYNETHQLWEHCICPEGFFGIQCEHQLQICPGGGHICLHGSQCISEGGTTNGNRSQACDCSPAFNSAQQYAGKFCQYTSTDICTKTGQSGTGTSNVAFCVNNGKCKANVSQNEPHPGCECTDGFHGSHCELSNSQSIAMVDTHGKSGGNSLATVVAVAVSVLVVAMVGGIQLRKFIEPTADGGDDIVKEDPADNTYDADTQGGTSGMVTEEDTADMQPPFPVPPMMEEKELRTVEII